MHKLFRLKKWVRIGEAAAYLSTVLEEPVLERDLYAIALEGGLVISAGLPRTLIANPVSVYATKAEHDAAVSSGAWERLIVSRIKYGAYAKSQGYDGIFDMTLLGGEIEFVRHMAFSDQSDAYEGYAFDEAILRCADGQLIRPLDTNWDSAANAVQEAPWYGPFPADVQMCVRMGELNRLIRSLTTGTSDEPMSGGARNRAAQGIESYEKAAAIPNFLDPMHPRFSSKLAAAVNAWLAIDDMEGRSPKELAEDWLTKNASKFGLTKADGTLNTLGITECAKVVNWRAQGGVPRTPGREV